MDQSDFAGIEVSKDELLVALRHVRAQYLDSELYKS